MGLIFPLRLGLFQLLELKNKSLKPSGITEISDEAAGLQVRLAANF